MPTIAIVATMVLGVLLLLSISGRKPAAGSIRVIHRLLAVLSIAAAFWKGGPLILDSTILVGAFGFTSARIRRRNDTLATVLFLAHVVGAISLLIIAGVSLHYGFGPNG